MEQTILKSLQTLSGRSFELPQGETLAQMRLRTLNEAAAPADGYDCPVCRNHSRAYVRHLFKAKEQLGGRLAVMHNLYFYNTLLEKIRAALDAGKFAQFRKDYSERLAQRL